MANPRTVANAFAAFARLFKSVPEGELRERLDDALDQWDDHGRQQHVTPSARKLGIGPEQAASGEGAARMASMFSDDAPQLGTAEQYAQIGRLLNELRSLLATTSSPVPQTIFPPDESTFVGKATTQLKRAKAELRKAELSDEPDEAEVRKSSLAEARRLLESGRRLLQKAVEEGEEEGESDGEALDSATATLKKLSALLSDFERGGPSAKSSVGGMPQLSVPEFIEALSRTSRNPTPPDFSSQYMAKAGAANDALAARIEAAEDSGVLSPDEALRAETLRGFLALAKAGRLPMDAFMQELQLKSPRRVQEMFGVEAVPGRLTLVR